jgi:orotidine-5'-phosphate decarboxylase
MTTQPKDRIIVALDVPTFGEATAAIEALAPHVGMAKVGLELITAIGGPHAVAAVHGAKCAVMYDGKFNDIPNTMAGAAKALTTQDVRMFTVHASAGRAAVRAAVEAAGKSLVIGVTVLTSLDDESCIEIFGEKPSKKVRRFAETLVAAGAQAIVCSPQEVANLADLPLLRITPGVRPAWAPANDQKRVMTPGEAILAGADMLVIGRPILKPPAAIGTPVAAARLIADEIAQALERKAALDALKRAEGPECGGGC